RRGRARGFDTDRRPAVPRRAGPDRRARPPAGHLGAAARRQRGARRGRGPGRRGAAPRLAAGRHPARGQGGPHRARALGDRDPARPTGRARGIPESPEGSEPAEPLMRVLVTGASGMLGRAVADTLAARGDDITVLQRRPSGSPHREVLGDVSDRTTAAEATDRQDAVIRLAAKVDVVGPWEDYLRTNVEGTRTLIRAARASGVSRFVQVSSPSVAHAGDSLAGVGAGPADPGRARGNYARSKAAAEVIALDADDAALAVTAIRPHLVWGPGDTQLIGRILDRARAGRLPLVGAGTRLVDTTYVTNAADAIVAGLDRIEVAHGQALVVTNG